MRNAAGKVFRYMPTKVISDEYIKEVSSCDIVLTTYSEVMKSYPRPDVPVDLQTSQEKRDWWLKYYEEKKGILHHIEWRRVVLDEAQAIKCHSSRTSIACRNLRATYRWALSGTPILNSLTELYPYFKFLRIPGAGSYKIFKANFWGNNDARKVQRLQELLTTFMIRRTHADILFGAPLLKLPPNSEQIYWCQFNDLERSIYEIVRRRMITRLHDFVKQKTVKRNYSNILTMILRLRQLCGHILMVDVVLQDLLEWEDHERLREIAEAELHPNMTQDRQKQIFALRKALATTAIPKQKLNPDRAELSEEASPSTNTGVETSNPRSSSPITILEDDLGVSFRQNHFFKYLESLRHGKNWERLTNSTLCHSCHQPPADPHLTSCYHIYCKECIESILHSAAVHGSDKSRCLECGVVFEKTWQISQDKLTDAQNANPNYSRTVNFIDDEISRESKAMSQTLRDELSVKRWIAKAEVLPSAKTMAIKAQLMNWFQEKPDQKVIIYTQFISMIHILSKICQIEGWGFETVSLDLKSSTAQFGHSFQTGT